MTTEAQGQISALNLESSQVGQSEHPDLVWTKKHFKKLLFFQLFNLFFLFAFNFLGSPAVKWIYSIQALLTFFCVFKMPWEYAIIPVLIFFFVEGQGRIVWSYMAPARLAFDGCVAIVIMKWLIRTKKIIPTKKIPTFFLFCFLGHLFWYGVQLFNIKSVGFFGVLAAAKIYIFPIIMFFMFLSNPLSKERINGIFWIVLILVIAECILSIYQMGEKEQLVLKITPYYTKALKGETFSGEAYRPFGTTYLPGAISVYLFLTAGFLFIKKNLKKYETVLVIITLAMSWFGLFIMQVRSAMIKHVAICAFISVIVFFSKAKKVKMAAQGALSLGFLIFTFVALMPQIESLFPNIDFTYATKRFTELGDRKKLSSSRITPSEFIEVFYEKVVDHPLGLGPGRTGAASSVAIDKILKDPVYGKLASWSHDNLFISLLIDLGAGMIFYGFIIIFMPVYLAGIAFKAWLDGKQDLLYHTGLAAVVSVFILLGNWGAIGIPYNPESFCFWFWLAYGLNAKFEGERANDSVL